MFHCLCRVLLYSKTPRQVFFNPINVWTSFTHTLFTLSIFFILTSNCFRQGETGDEFYVIESGEVKFSTIKTEGAAPEDIGTCFQNEFFGEGSLLTENPRRATAIANGETVCYSLSGRSFRLIFGK